MDALLVINRLTDQNAGEQTYYKYELQNVLVTSYSVSGAGQ